jgi:hypothetical protein
MFAHLKEKIPMLHDKKKLLLFVVVIFSLFLASPARFIEKKVITENDKLEATGLAGANLAISGLLLLFMLWVKCTEVVLNHLQKITCMCSQALHVP